MSTKTQQPNIKESFVELFHKHHKELNNGLPGFINKTREQALENFRKTGIPTKKQEKYKYTDLTQVFEKSYRNYFQPKPIDFKIDEMFQCDVPELDTSTIILLNGWYYDQKNPLKKLDSGVIIGSLREAAKQYPELVKNHYNQYADNENESLTALNTAFAQDGVFFYAPKGAVMERPIQIINILLDEEAGMSQHRNLFIAEENSQANLIICDHTLTQQTFLTNSVTEVFVNQSAHFDLARIQNEHNGATQLSQIYLQQEKDSNASTNTITLHGGLVKNDYNIKLNGEGCHNNTLGLFLSDRGQHIDNYVYIDHAKPHSQSNQLFKGVLDDFATGAFNGRILVRKDAQKTEAYQSNNNILLTDDAKMNTKPQLEIYADDVKCSHGATVGQIDQNALFYLRSRGINYKEARLLLMYAFAHEVIEKITAKPLQERIDELVNKRLRGELSRCNYCELHCH
ncbi:MAG: Fe-S cluster assembly protein SufD [Bacteroidales bacterium]